jgi:glycosyltransferase involved in cell wall biosynthesis
VSRHLRRSIESYGVRARFRVVANTVDVGVFHPSRDIPRRPPTRLINVALHVEVKGLDVLLRAFARLVQRRGPLTLELIGEGPLTLDLRRLAEELGVAEHVRFVGTATPEQVAAALRAAHIFVLSSHSENMPLAVLEALCCGLPVVATEVGGVPEAVEAGAGVLAPPGDAEALADAIETALDGYERFDRTGIARRAAARWSFESVGGIWDEIYRSL